MQRKVKDKIKVLHLIKSLGRGGAEKLIPETVLVHDQSLFEFHCIYFYHQESNIAEELEKAGIKVSLIPSSNLGLFFQIGKVRDFIVRHQIDLIHAHLPWAGILARAVGKMLPVPIVYTEHNTWERYNLVSYWGNRLSFKKQDIAIAVSNEVALSMRLNTIWDPYRRGGRMKVKVIQNGVNTDTFYRAASSELSPSHQDTFSTLRSKLGIPKEAPVVGKVAVFRSQKRLWLWVQVALDILESCPQTHFLLVGDGEWRGRILQQIQASGKEANFHWVGVQKEVVPYLSIMDIYLSTSEFEGLPIAMLEAMSCEVAVVATSAGGIGEVIQHGYQGYLTEIDKWQDLAEHCIELINNAELLEKMRTAARQRVLDGFSMKRMVNELEETYREVLYK
ncbi:glycosyltransferase [Algoriphagus sp. H41]|uniref:Glycosyltransferase n=1 Tax=Algoriphagus oliviformis TaxID=2811231 RepID=A0ABS3C7F7_9BACT|nr:glycosyltransferase [Algoriphagus oliviformis]MBN7813042.1 glycosyltransferase [Algoriphagus oliviformis]